MCRLVSEAALRGGQCDCLLYHMSVSAYYPVPCLDSDKQVIADARRIAGETNESIWLPTDPRDLAGKIFHTCYMGTENSSVDTRGRAKMLAEAIGA